MIAISTACGSDTGDYQPPAEIESAATARTLDNGLRVVVAPNHTQPIVTALIGFHAGSFVESEEQSGYSHLLEHMLFKGSGQLPDPVEFEDRLHALGIEANATTGRDHVEYYYVNPEANLEPALELLAGAVRTPLLDAGELDKEIKVVLAEVDIDDSDWQNVQQRRVLHRLFDRYPNRVDPLGDRSAVAAATPATLRELFDTYYQPNNAQLVLAGDVAAERAFALAERDFGDWQRGPDPFASHPVPVQPALQSDASDVISAPVHVSQLMVAYQGPSTRDDFRDAVAADVLATISKLDGQDFRRLVTGDEIVGARIFHWASPEKGVIGLALTIGSGQEAAAISELRMMRDWLNTITRAQIGAAKDLLWTRRFQDQDVDLTLAQDASADWAASGTGSPHDYLQTLYAIEHADLERVVARYVTGAARAAVLVTDPEHADIDLGATLRAAW